MSTGLLGFEEVQQRPGGVWEYVSPSRLSCWLACPLRWAFRYRDGLRTPTTASLFTGKAVHASLECYYRHRQLGVTLEADEVNRRSLESWAQLVDEENMTFDSPESEGAMQRQVSDLVRVYLDTVPKDEKPLAVEVAAEAPLVDPFTGEDLGLPMVGVIDLVLDGQAGPIIVDHKTAARSSEPMEISHDIQLSSYAWLYRQITGQQEAGLEIRSLIKTKVPKCEFHPYAARTEAHFRRLFAVLHEYVDALGRDTFNYRPGFGCALCDFREQCRAWAGYSALCRISVFDRQPPSWLPVSSVPAVNRDGGRITLVSGEKNMRVQNSMKKSFDNARAVAHKAVAKLPAATVRGFHDGRKAGHDFIENAPYIAGAAVGLVYGTGEAIVGALAEPVSSVFGWAVSLVYGE